MNVGSYISLSAGILLVLASCCKYNKKPDTSVEEPVTANVETYEYSRKVALSQQYEVLIGGKPQRVIPTTEPHVCAFGCDDSVKVEINLLTEKLSSVVVRPTNKRPKYEQSGNGIVLKMGPYDRYDIEFNGNESTPLFIFANPIDDAKPSKDDPNVKYFEAGQYYDQGQLTMTAGQTIYIEGGAVVKGNISVSGQDNITIAGGGILDNRSNDGRAFFIRKCNDVTVRDITVLSRTNWTTLFCECDNVEADGYKAVAVFSEKSDGTGNENDGFDLLASRHVTATHCFSYCHDDAFCVKSQKWAYSGVSEDILFDDCIAWNKDCGNSFIVGYECNQDVSNVRFRNCYSIHSAGSKTELRRGALSIDQGASGKYSDILYENIYIEDPKEYGIYLRIIKTSYNIGNDVEWAPGTMDGITLRNIYIDKMPPYGNYIAGYDEQHKISSFIIENLHICGTKVASNENALFRTCKYADVSYK